MPDALTSAGGAEGDIYPGVSCPGAPTNGISTSCNNHFSGNKMGQVPPGFEFPAKLDEFDVPHGTINGSAPLPNGVDFWWDEFSGNTGNCWFNNTGFDGSPGTVTGSGDAGSMPGIPPNPLPDCSGGESPDSSVGMGDPAKTQYLIDCASGPNAGTSSLRLVRAGRAAWQRRRGACARRGGPSGACLREDGRGRQNQRARRRAVSGCRRLGLPG